MLLEPKCSVEPTSRAASRVRRGIRSPNFYFPSRRAPGGRRTGDPSKKTGGGTLATPARTRPKREGACGAEKVDSPSAAATPPPGPGRARTAELATARRPRPMLTPTRRDRTAAGPVSAVDARTVVGAARRAAGAAERRGAAAAARGLQRHGPARPSRGRAWAAVTRRVACVRSARSAHGPKTLALRARGARARGKKRRAGVLGRRRRPRRETASVKGGRCPLLGPIGFLWHSIVWWIRLITGV